jgi:pilus assembly protein CpaE
MVWATDIQRVRRLLEFALRHYRYVIVDCPRSDATVLDALETATKLVLVANQELATLRSGSRMAATLRQRYGSQRVMVVVSRFDSNSEIGHADVERVIGSSVKHLVPSDYRASLDALNHGKPLVTKNGTRLAGSLGKLAEELTGADQTDTKQIKTTTSGIFGRLTGRR